MSAQQPGEPGRAAAALGDRLVLPGRDGRWDEARRAWNLTVDQEPAAVVVPESAEDVAAAVELALERGQRLAAQTTGHSAAPLVAYGPLGDTILLKTQRMRGVAVDPDARAVRVEAGVVWADAVAAAAGHGLAPLAGSAPNVGVAGYTLGGGISGLGRRYGLACNSVEAVELVTADGRMVRADRDSEPDLFWALRGGGGSFGAVTAMELRLFPVAEVYAGSLWWPIERGDEVWHAWAELTRGDPPDELVTVGRYLRFPPLPQIPEPIRGGSFAVVEAIWLGEAADADALLEPLRALGPVTDTIVTMPARDLGTVHMDPEDPTPNVTDGLSLTDLPVEAVDELVRVAGADSGSSLTVVDVRNLGGELGRPRPDGGALASIEAPYLMTVGGIAPTPELGAAAAAQVAAVRSAMEPWMARQINLNFADTPRDPSSFWTAEAYQRLRRIKTTTDPGDLFRSSHPVPPM
jgi:hypothetical protein